MKKVGKAIDELNTRINTLTCLQVIMDSLESTFNIQYMYETDTLKIVTVFDNFTVDTVKYGMPESTFMKYAVELKKGSETEETEETEES